MEDTKLVFERVYNSSTNLPVDSYKVDSATQEALKKQLHPTFDLMVAHLVDMRNLFLQSLADTPGLDNHLKLLQLHRGQLNRRLLEVKNELIDMYLQRDHPPVSVTQPCNFNPFGSDLADDDDFFQVVPNQTDLVANLPELPVLPPAPQQQPPVYQPPKQQTAPIYSQPVQQTPQTIPPQSTFPQMPQSTFPQMPPATQQQAKPYAPPQNNPTESVFMLPSPQPQYNQNPAPPAYLPPNQPPPQPQYAGQPGPQPPNNNQAPQSHNFFQSTYNPNPNGPAPNNPNSYNPNPSNYYGQPPAPQNNYGEPAPGSYPGSNQTGGPNAYESRMPATQTGQNYGMPTQSNQPNYSQPRKNSNESAFYVDYPQQNSKNMANYQPVYDRGPVNNNPNQLIEDTKLIGPTQLGDNGLKSCMNADIVRIGYDEFILSGAKQVVKYTRSTNVSQSFSNPLVGILNYRLYQSFEVMIDLTGDLYIINLGQRVFFAPKVFKLNYMKTYFNNSKNFFIVDQFLYFLTNTDKALLQCDLKEMIAQPANYRIPTSCKTLLKGADHFFVEPSGDVWSLTEQGLVENPKTGRKQKVQLDANEAQCFFSNITVMNGNIVTSVFDNEVKINFLHLLNKEMNVKDSFMMLEQVTPIHKMELFDRLGLLHLVLIECQRVSLLILSNYTFHAIEVDKKITDSRINALIVLPETSEILFTDLNRSIKAFEVK